MTAEPGDDPIDTTAWKARLDALLAELAAQVGPARAREVAHAAFADCAARAFGAPQLDEGTATRTRLRHAYPRIVGRSPALLRVLVTLDRIIDSELPVLITGESGTGKELIARAIHENGPRRERAFVRENCAAITETLLESELFGHRRGAFTGAVQDKKGLFEEGDGGCVFLDEIGEMSLAMQAKLMRVLQEGEIRPVGATTPIHVDIRLISATNRDLRKLASEGKFREDLFFRLNVVPIHMPPLRDRTEDIPELAATFLAAAAARTGRPAKELDPAALACLMRHPWPGNIRELENEIQRAFALAGPVIQPSDFSEEVAAGPDHARRAKRAKS